MADPRHMHEFIPNRKGRCKRIVGSEHCGLPECAIAHARYRETTQQTLDDATIEYEDKQLRREELSK
jgi:hypothetical protein